MVFVGYFLQFKFMFLKKTQISAEIIEAMHEFEA